MKGNMIARLLTVATVIFLLISCCPVTTLAATVTPITRNGAIVGDTNGDKKVTEDDYTLLCRYVRDRGSFTGTINKTAADVDADGKITVLDRIRLARFLNKWENTSSFFETVTGLGVNSGGLGGKGQGADFEDLFK